MFMGLKLVFWVVYDATSPVSYQNVESNMLTYICFGDKKLIAFMKTIVINNLISRKAFDFHDLAQMLLHHCLLAILYVTQGLMESRNVMCLLYSHKDISKFMKY